MHFHQQIQHYRTRSQMSLAVARQFTDYLDRAAIYKGMPLRESDAHRKAAYLLQQAGLRIEKHIREHLNAFALCRMHGGGEGDGTQPLRDLPAMIVLEQELTPQLLQSGQEVAEHIDRFLLSLCEDLKGKTLHDIRFIQDILRLRRRLNGDPPEEIFAGIALC